MNMKKWLETQRALDVKKAIPILSFPSVQLLGISVFDLIFNSGVQAQGIKKIAERCDSGASVSMMDLSVEAEAFGAKIRISLDEVPTIVGKLIGSKQEALDLRIPEIGDGRTGLYIDAIKKAVRLITDRPVFAGVIGPFSLAGRLMDMTEIMINCYLDPEMVHIVLEKAAEFSIRYIAGYKAAGANGVVMAEPAAGLLSPELNREFSVPYVERIVEAVQEDDFIVIYHNCGNTMLEKVPSNVIVMGNIDPSGQFRNGTPDSIREATISIMAECCRHRNFVISSGCDIPPLASWENIDAFFQAVAQFYGERAVASGTGN